MNRVFPPQTKQCKRLREKGILLNVRKDDPMLIRGRDLRARAGRDMQAKLQEA